VAGAAVDPSFIKASEGTGGQVFLFDRSEAGRSLVLVRNTHKHEHTIYRSMGTLSTGSREFFFPVDSTVESLMLSISLQCSQSITVYRPGDTEVHGGEPDADENRFKSGLILILTRPTAGPWRVRMAGIGMYFAAVTAKSSISIDRAEFVELAGRPGHQGLFPIEGPVRVGEQRMLLVDLRAPAGDKSFRLVNAAGDTLEPLDLKPVAESGGQSQFTGAFVLEHPEFRVAVQGVDAAGYPYQRVQAALFAASPAN